MSKIFNILNFEHDFCTIISLMNEIVENLHRGNINRVVMIDKSIHKSLKSIKQNYSCLSYQTSQIITLMFAVKSLKHITYIFKIFFDFIDSQFIDTQCNINIKNRDIFDYCDSALQQINSYINNFHYERMKAL